MKSQSSLPDGAGSATPAMAVRAGEPFTLNWKQQGHGWAGEFHVTPAKDNTVFVKMNITQENGAKLTPALLLRLGERGSVELAKQGEPTFKVGITVTRSGA